MKLDLIHQVSFCFLFNNLQHDKSIRKEACKSLVSEDWQEGQGCFYICIYRYMYIFLKAMVCRAHYLLCKQNHLQNSLLETYRTNPTVRTLNMTDPALPKFMLQLISRYGCLFLVFLYNCDHTKYEKSAPPSASFLKHPTTHIAP